jgi:hypothetical protein
LRVAVDHDDVVAVLEHSRLRPRGRPRRASASTHSAPPAAPPQFFHDCSRTLACPVAPRRRSPPPSRTVRPPRRVCSIPARSRRSDSLAERPPSVSRVAERELRPPRSPCGARRRQRAPSCSRRSPNQYRQSAVALPSPRVGSLPTRVISQRAAPVRTQDDKPPRSLGRRSPVGPRARRSAVPGGQRSLPVRSGPAGPRAWDLSRARFRAPPGTM